MAALEVLQVNKLYQPHVGGVEEVVRLLAEGCAGRQDIHARVLVCNEGMRTVRETVRGVDVTRVGSLGRLRSEPLAPAFPRHLLRSDADIYHFHAPFPLGEAAGLRLGGEKKIVTWYHSDVIRQRLFLRAYRPLLERFLARNSAIMVSSPNLISSSPFLGPLADRCRVVHFGIETGRFRLDEKTAAAAAGLRERYESGGGLVLCVGRLVYYKGLEHLIDAMGEVDAGLLILGRGPLRGELQRRAEAGGISRRVHFVDWASSEELPSFYHACDLLVLPSVARSEAFGLVLLEAQACGKPVISTELGTGTSYVNLDGVTGIVVPPGAARSLAAAIASLLGDARLREEMGTRGRERVEREFGLSAMIDRVAAIYAEVMQGNGGIRGTGS